MKTTFIFAIFSFIFFLTSCQDNKVGQFKAIISGQPITIGYANQSFNSGDTVYLHQYSGSGWALSDQDEIDNNDAVRAVFQFQIEKPAGVFQVNKIGQFKNIENGHLVSVGYDADLVLSVGQKVYLHEYSMGWGLAAPDDTTGTKVVFVK